MVALWNSRSLEAIILVENGHDLFEGKIFIDIQMLELFLLLFPLGG
jgi:hypothetical protein